MRGEDENKTLKSRVHKSTTPPEYHGTQYHMFLNHFFVNKSCWNTHLVQIKISHLHR